MPMQIKSLFYPIVFGILVLPSITIAAPSFDCQKATLMADKLVCQDAVLSGQDKQMNTNYNRLKKLFLLTAEEKNLTSLVDAQKTWLQQKNKCTDISCVRGLYAQQQTQLKGWLEAADKNGYAHAAIPYEEPINISIPFEQALKQKDAAPFLKTDLKPPILIQYNKTDDTLYSEAENQVFLSAAEFSNYFSLIFQDALSDQHDWQFAVAALGSGDASKNPFIVLGYPSNDPATRYLLINSRGSIIAITSKLGMPEELKKLAAQHEAMFKAAKSITGHYLNSGGELFVQQLSPTNTQLHINLVQGNLGTFSGISHDGSSGKMVFLATTDDTYRKLSHDCKITVIFSPTKAIVDNGCDDAALFGADVLAAGSYLRGDATAPTHDEMTTDL